MSGLSEQERRDVWLTMHNGRDVTAMVERIKADAVAAAREEAAAKVEELAGRDRLLDCECGHDIGSEHNSNGCYHIDWGSLTLTQGHVDLSIQDGPNVITDREFCWCDEPWPCSTARARDALVEALGVTP